MGTEAGLDLWSSEVLLDPWDHFRDVRAVLRDWQTFTSADGVAEPDVRTARIGQP